MIERNLYLDAQGASQIQRQVQVKLEDIYVSLRAERDYEPGAVDRPTANAELAELEQAAHTMLPFDGLEDREPLLAHFEGRDPNVLTQAADDILELSEAVNRNERLVILGDPGSGKSTLLRYLALKHARALYEGQDEINQELGATRFPILIRVADYAESGFQARQSLSDFLPEYCGRHECPSIGLADLLTTELSKGNCLILLDGLDEIVSADDRRGVVRQIEDFMRRHGNIRNRFVITSRIAGYRIAPLRGQLPHYNVQDMNELQIQHFLERWCIAVEIAETEDLPLEMQESRAQKEINGILQAVRTSPGVRRLATNPLLLCTLALIHRATARLPQKRIELYKTAADTLGRTWRPAQGVPELALAGDEYLTPILSKLAYWLHGNKPSGIATEEEVKNVAGKEWARLEGVQWDSETPPPSIVSDVNRFLLNVREHTGLFVEREPRRYGFMHLTFEEYYAARFLAACRPRNRPKLMREHLHDPRWEEPILLAMGFVGMDYREQAADLLETAILARGEEAEELGLEPRPYEDLLGHDYLFAIRCLGDQVPARPRIVRELTSRLSEELLYRKGSARFTRYRDALLQMLKHFEGSSGAAANLVEDFTSAIDHDEASVRYRAAVALVRLNQVSSRVVNIILDDAEGERPKTVFDNITILTHADSISPEVVSLVLKRISEGKTWQRAFCC